MPLHAADFSVKRLKNHVASQFSNLELTNAVVLQMMPSVSCGFNVDITWLKSHIAPCFNHFDLPKKWCH